MTEAASVRRSVPSWPWALGIDAVLVIVFAVIGRASHERAVDALGVLETAWPFLVGLAAGWLVLRAWRAPAAPVRTGVLLAVVTVVLGMILRVVSGGTTAVAFIIVATVSLLVFLGGWRAIAALVVRPRAHR
ncbi:DUF3054 domain-containing protein [Microbacterium sp. Au-Mic1]|uniref:DUF3054 domain-containing protein n=1 Tax=Microbacterium sp. Au-Mic1 TaxID=2906457 RepID=UPI001E402270|nr:DUF3054 domain-containing protein [Microbacterium sp. Au-Mic1]MCE4027058.1 DUF3054 domain-containing protein [Microbacterium sp. Au-Mic1]